MARASYSRYAGQLEPARVGVTNPSSTAGSATYRWVDLNGDHFAQADEVLFNQFITAARRLQPRQPDGGELGQRARPESGGAGDAERVVAGVDRELRPNLALQVNYSYTRTSDLFGNFTDRVTPRVGVTLADYAPGPTLPARCPTARRYSVPTYIPNAAKVAAGGNGFLHDQHPGLLRPTTTALELSVVKRLSNKWMGRVGVRVEQRPRALRRRQRHLRHQRQPDADRQRSRFRRRPVRAAERRQRLGQYLHQRQVAVQRERAVPGALRPRLSGNVFGRQGYPYPLFRQGPARRSAATRRCRCCVTPQIDTFRYDNLWDTDLRVARTFKFEHRQVRASASATCSTCSTRTRCWSGTTTLLSTELQRHRAEPQPADFPGGLGGRVLRTDRGDRKGRWGKCVLCDLCVLRGFFRSLLLRDLLVQNRRRDDAVVEVARRRASRSARARSRRASPTPNSTDGRPSSSWNVDTTGIDPPSRVNTGFRPKPRSMARPAACTNGLSNDVIHGLPPCMRVTLSSTVFGRDLAHVSLEQLGNLVRSLIRHQPHADLRHRDGRQHRLRAFAGEAGQQAVDLEGRPRPGALERRVAGLAEQLGDAEILAVSASR